MSRLFSETETHGGGAIGDDDIVDISEINDGSRRVMPSKGCSAQFDRRTGPHSLFDSVDEE